MKSISRLISEIDNVKIDNCAIDIAYKKLLQIYSQIINRDSEFPETVINTNTPFFRARQIPNHTYIDNISEFIPLKNQTTFGRLNIPDKPVYYCAESVTTTILEMNPKIGANLVILESELQSDMKTAALAQNERYTITGNVSDNLKLLIEFINSKITDKIDRDNPEKYFYTATLGRLIMTDPDIKGIMYPSFYHDGLADNFAIKIEFAKDNLKFIRARHFKVTDIYSDRKVKLKCIYHADNVSQNGQLLWKATYDCPTHLIDSNSPIRTLKIY